MNIINTAIAADVAAAAPASQSPGIMEIGMLLFFFFIFYLLIWRPQSKRAKEQRNLIASLTKNDEVVMSGGLMGKIVEIGDTFVTLLVANGVNLQFQKQAVVAVLPKGTLKLGTTA